VHAQDGWCCRSLLLLLLLLQAEARLLLLQAADCPQTFVAVGKGAAVHHGSARREGMPRVVAVCSPRVLLLLLLHLLLLLLLVF
jgi:hypothetical protein